MIEKKEDEKKLGSTPTPSTQSSPSPGQTTPTYTVTFNVDDKTTTATTDTGKVTLPQAPTKQGYTFVGWNTAKNGTGTTFDTATVVNANTTVYAIFTKDQTTASAEELKVLTDAVIAAEASLAGTTEGTSVGEYTVGSKATLQTAIDTAQEVVDSGTATTSEVSAAVASAVSTFEAVIVAAGDAQALTNYI